MDGHSSFISLRYRLGLPVYVAHKGKETWRCPSCKNGNVDVMGHHATICPGKHGLTARHDSIKQCVAKIAFDSGYVGIETEPPQLTVESKQRPADVYIPAFEGCKPAWIDVSVVSPLCDGVWHHSTRKRCYAAGKAEKAKERKYLECADAQGAVFIPCVMEEFGGFGERAVRFLKALSYGYSGQQGCTVSEAMNRIMQRLSFESQRALAQSLQARKPDAQFA